MTESTIINSLAYHRIWSTIKTLPATLPEPRPVVRGPSFEAQGPSFTDHGPAATDRGPRTGVTEGVSKSESDLMRGGGALIRLDGVPWTLGLDGLVEAVKDNFMTRVKY